nr:MAG TPA: hypothetical protein [Bacteriophage sp.]
MLTYRDPAQLRLGFLLCQLFNGNPKISYLP